MAEQAQVPRGTEPEPVKRKEVFHDETPSMITDHKFSPIGEWWTRCRYCRLSEAAHTESEIQYYGDDET